MRRRAPSIAVCATLAVFLMPSYPLAAQTVTGTVKHGGTGEPVADASVVLLDRNGRVQRGTLTELDGTFSLVAPEKGSYSLRIGAMGFVTRDTPPLRIEGDDLRPLEILLRPDDDSGILGGFNERMARGEGVFITREQIKQRSGNRFSDIMRFVPGVDVINLPEGQRLSDWTSTPGFTTEIGRRSEADLGGATQYYTIRVKAGQDFRRAEAGAIQRGEAASDCPPVLWVDGLWWGSIDESSPRGPDMAIMPDDIEAIEIYSHPSIIPDQFDSGRDALCGVVVLWRKQ